MVQHVQRIHESKSLHGAHRVEHVRVVTRRGAEATILVLAREQELDSLVSGQSFGVPEQVQGRETPVHPVEPQVLGQPVLVRVLARVQGLDIADVGGCSEVERRWWRL